jgi:hypothetical protein
MSEGEPKRRLEGFAARLLVENRVIDAMRAIDTASRCKNSEQMVSVLMGYLLVHCLNRSQLSQVSWVLDEAVTLPPAVEAPLRLKEYEIYVKFKDAAGIAKCSRRLDRLNDC